MAEITADQGATLVAGFLADQFVELAPIERHLMLLVALVSERMESGQSHCFALELLIELAQEMGLPDAAALLARGAH